MNHSNKLPNKICSILSPRQVTFHNNKKSVMYKPFLYDQKSAKYQRQLNLITSHMSGCSDEPVITDEQQNKNIFISLLHLFHDLYFPIFRSSDITNYLVIIKIST